MFRLIFFILIITVIQLWGDNRNESYLKISFYINTNELTAAEELIDKHLETFPDDPFILTEKSYLMLKQKQSFEKIIPLLKKSLKIYPEYYYSNYLLASLRYSEYLNNQEKKKSLDDSLEYLKTSLKDSGGFFDSNFLAGVILKEKGFLKQANEYFEKASSIRTEPMVFYYMADNYNKLNDTRGEISSYKEILKLDPFNKKVLSQLSQIYLKRKDYENARLYLERIFLLYPDDKKIIYEYLYLLFLSGDADKFLKISRKVNIADFPLLLYAKAFFLTRKRDFDKALALVESHKVKDLRIQLLLAEIYVNKKNYYSSLQILNKIEVKDRDYIYYSLSLEVLSRLNLNTKIIKLYSSLKNSDNIIKKLDLHDYYNIILAFGNLHRFEQARKAAVFFRDSTNNKFPDLNNLINQITLFLKEDEIAITKEIDKFNIFLILQFYKNKKEFDKAVKILKKLLNFQENQDLYLALCDIYIQQGKLKKAEKILKKINTKYSASIIIKNYYAYCLALQNKNLSLALKLSADTLKEDEEDPSFIDTYGYILLKMGKIDESGKFLEKAYKKHPFEPEIIEHLVDFYSLKRDKKRIVNIYQKAIDNKVDFQDQMKEKLENVEKMFQ